MVFDSASFGENGWNESLKKRGVLIAVINRLVQGVF